MATVVTYLREHVLLPPVDESGSAADWAVELAPLSDAAYDIGDAKLGEDYYVRFAPQFLKQIRLAASRTAWLLNQIAGQRDLGIKAKAARDWLRAECKKGPGACPTRWF